MLLKKKMFESLSVWLAQRFGKDLSSFLSPSNRLRSGCWPPFHLFLVAVEAGCCGLSFRKNKKSWPLVHDLVSPILCYYMLGQRASSMSCLWKTSNRDDRRDVEEARHYLAGLQFCTTTTKAVTTVGLGWAHPWAEGVQHAMSFIVLP